MKKILIVDDENAVVKALERILTDTDREIYTANSGTKALEILDSTHMDLILCDMIMPEMDGYNLLSMVKSKYPNIIRIIISDHTQEKNMFKAILNNTANIYFLKPWNNDELLEGINRLFATQDVLNDNHILSYINKVEKLPTLQQNYLKIISMLEEDEEIDNITNEIENDLSLSTMLLHIANSAFYGARTGSIKQAVMFIGMNNLKSLIYTSSVLNMANKIKDEKGLISSTFKHATLTNKLVEFIYKNFLKKKLPQECCSIGLLHNVGVVLLLSEFYNECIENIARNGFSLRNISEVEKKCFNISHEELGAYLIYWWNLPYTYLEVALYHHEPGNKAIINSEIVKVVHIAQYYAWKIINTDFLTELYEIEFDNLQIDKGEFENSLAEFVGV